MTERRFLDRAVTGIMLRWIRLLRPAPARCFREKPLPWFRAKAIGGSHNYVFDTAAGRYMLMLFFGRATQEGAAEALACVARHRGPVRRRQRLLLRGDLGPRGRGRGPGRAAAPRDPLLPRSGRRSGGSVRSRAGGGGGGRSEALAAGRSDAPGGRRLSDRGGRGRDRRAQEGHGPYAAARLGAGADGAQHPRARLVRTADRASPRDRRRAFGLHARGGRQDGPDHRPQPQDAPRPGNRRRDPVRSASGAGSSAGWCRW